MNGPANDHRRTLVKVCGIRGEEALAAAIRSGADLAGFVFAESRRRVTAEQAARLTAVLGDGDGRLRTAGVFVNPAIAELDRVMEAAKLDVIQLHGSETPDFCLEVKRRYPGVSVFKAIAAKPAETEPEDSADGQGEAAGEGIGESGGNQIEAFRHVASYGDIVDAFLLDTLGGGTGKRFAWEIIPPYQAACERFGVKLFVAGGLDPSNVAELVDRYRPDGVDVSSGVETGGVKDTGKIAAFIERVRSIDRQRA